MDIADSDLIYDFVFITHIPSFYKINLYNEISKFRRLFVIFLGESSQERNADFVNGQKNFDYYFLNRGYFERRNRYISICRLILKLRSLKYKKMFLGAWDLPESWLAIFFSNKKSNILSQESSIFESKLTGFKYLLKRLFVSRLGLALVSGMPHARLMNRVGFKGKIHITGGVGLTNRMQKSTIIKRNFSGRFLYVGRLSPEKNLSFLLRAFALPSMVDFHLTLVGDGPARSELQSIAGRNITFMGHVPNGQLHVVYAANDVFVLPSLSEPWGLVVEEALYCGLPVLASKKVGCAEDLVINTGSGLCFDPSSDESLIEVVSLMVSEYHKFYVNAYNIDFVGRDADQVGVYVNVLNC